MYTNLVGKPISFTHLIPLLILRNVISRISHDRQIGHLRTSEGIRAKKFDLFRRGILKLPPDDASVIRIF